MDDPHPDLFAIFNGELVGNAEGSFSRIAFDLLCLSEVLKNCDPRIQRMARNVISSSHPIVTTVDAPANNLLHVRFIPSREKRDELRQWKTWERVSMHGAFPEGERTWNASPSDFHGFQRYNNPYEADIAKAIQRRDYFSGLGLIAMAQEIETSIASMMRMGTNGQYCGFVPILFQTAAMILAKSVGYQFYGRPGQFRNDIVYADKDVFEGYDFYDRDCENSSFSDRDRVEYWPRAYPLHELWDRASGEIKKLIDHLEAFPELNHKPAFDHYRVVLPTIHYPSSYMYAPYVYYRDIRGRRMDFNSIEEAQNSFDRHLWDHKYIYGVLLGERDGQHYFISYFL